MTHDEKAAWALTLLTSGVANSLKSIKRVYPDSLVKYEPGDLMDIQLPLPKRTKGAREVYAKAIELCRAGMFAKSRQLADDWFECAS